MTIEKAWKNWKNALESNDINSVFIQITSMVWDTAIFKIIYEGQKTKFKNRPKNPRINHSLYSFILRNYLLTQTTYIRRLTDSSYGIEGEKGTYSLRAIIEDIKKYRVVLTRQKFFNLNQMLYDTSKIKQERDLFFRNNSGAETALNIPPELDWITIEETHKTFDKLSNTVYEQRNPSDTIDNEVLGYLVEMLDSCERISNYVNKFVAHSATPESRSLMNQDQYQVSLSDIWNAHKKILDVANFISATLFSIDHMALPDEPPGFFDYWEEPLFEKDGLIETRNILNKYKKEMESWRISSNTDIWKAIQSNRKRNSVD
ncbi:hypothetical protein KQH62_00025 [bacterium]|nr:hypothetical protein [bacterium]